jgi:hypothetical protein
VSISLPPRPPGLDDVRPLDPEALIEEARRRARRRRRRNVAGVLAALLERSGCTRSSVEVARERSCLLSNPARVGAAPLQSALPQELSVDDNGSVVLFGRDGTRQVLAPEPFGVLRTVGGVFECTAASSGRQTARGCRRPPAIS